MTSEPRVPHDQGSAGGRARDTEVRRRGSELLLTARRRPLSTTAAICTVAVAIFEIGQIVRGNLYLAALDHPDGTTLLMLCGLMIAGLISLSQRSDLQACAFAMVTALSCVIAYEAIFKWSFYLAPFGREMPPSELREFVLQVAVAATVLTAFADHHLAARNGTWMWLSVFGGLWAVWLLIGFPQLDGRLVHPQLLPWDLDRDQVYLLNRCSKVALFIAYYTVLPPLRRSAGETSEATPVGSGTA
jgi:hypothetical protein